MIDVSDRELQIFGQQKKENSDNMTITKTPHLITMNCFKGVKGQTPSKRGRRT